MPIATKEDYDFALNSLKSGQVPKEQIDGLLSNLEDYKMTGDVTPYNIRAPWKSETPTTGFAYEEPIRIPYSDDEKARAQQGVDIESGAPWGLRNKLDLARTDDERQKLITQYYGEGKTRSRNGPLGMEYFNPDTKKFTLLNPALNKMEAPTTSTVAGAALDATMGGAGYAKAGGGTIQRSLGSAAGVTTSSFGQELYKEFMRQSNGVSDGVDVTHAAEHAVGSGLLDLGTNLVLAAPKAVKWALRGSGPFSREQAADWLGQIDAQLAKERTQLSPIMFAKAQDLDRRVSQIIPNENSGQLRQLEGAISSAPGIGGEIYNQNTRNMSQLQAIYKSIVDGYKGDNQYGDAANLLNQRTDTILADRARQQAMAREISEAQVKLGAAGLGKEGAEDLSTSIQNMLGGIRKEDEDALNGAWSGFRQSAGMDARASGQRVPDDFLHPDSTYRGPQVEVGRELSTIINNVVGRESNRGFGREISGGVLGALPKEWQNGVKEGEMINLFDATDYLQHVNSGLRDAADRNLGKVPADRATEALVNKALTNNVEWYLARRGDPRILQSWENAKRSTADFSDKWRNSVLAQLAPGVSGVAPLPTRELIDTVVRGKSPQAIGQLADILKGSPSDYAEVQQKLLGIYNTEYLPGNQIPTRASWEKFKGDFGDALSTFYPGQEARMGTLEDFFTAAEGQAARAQQTEKEWKKSFYAYFGNKNSKQMANAYTNGNERKFAEMVDSTKSSDPNFLSALRYDNARSLADKVVSNGEIRTDILRGNLAKNENNLTKLYGEQYVSDLRSLADLYDSVQRGAVPSGQPPALMRSWLRTVFRPFSQEGLIQTATYTSRKANSANLANEAIKNPQALRDFVGYLDRDYRTRGAYNVLAALGVGSLWDGHD